MRAFDTPHSNHEMPRTPRVKRHCNLQKLRAGTLSRLHFGSRRSCACKNRCESDVKRLSEMLSHGRPAPVNPARLVSYDRVIFIMLMGAVFICLGLFYLRGPGPGMYVIGFGVLFFIFGISQFFAAKKFSEQFRDKKD